jgi:hypothetical protein
MHLTYRDSNEHPNAASAAGAGEAGAPEHKSDLTQASALDLLARELHWKMETLDPTRGDRDTDDYSSNGLWQAASDWERSFCRNCIEWIFARPELVKVALFGASNGNEVSERISPSE